VEVDDGLLAFFAEEEGAVGVGVHEEVFGEDGGGGGMAEEVEVFFEVGVAVGVVGAEAVAGEVDLGGLVEAGGEGIGPGVATGGVGAPAAGGEPAVASAGGVAVDGDEEDVVFAQLAAPLVHAAAALREGDILQLRNQKPGIEAQGDQVFLDLFCKEASVCVFAEEAVRAPLAGSVLAVAVVEEDCHSYRL